MPVLVLSNKFIAKEATIGQLGLLLVLVDFFSIVGLLDC